MTWQQPLRWPVLLLLLLLLLTACDRKPESLPSNPKMPPTLTEARRGFVTKIVKKESIGEAAPKPPEGMFDLVKYRSPIGELAAYVSHPLRDGAKHPAILWVVGGFSNSIGEVAWEPTPADNDQSASAFREAGVLMMYPSFRGGNDNPGVIENLYGEVDDLLAARDYLVAQPFVEPERVYLGGHSTGGTLVLLAAESESAKAFRAVFAFGPVDDVRGYGASSMQYDFGNPRESALRSPIKWLKAIQCPVFAFEGTKGNIDSLEALANATRDPAFRSFRIPRATHFAILRPLTRLVAQKILHDSGPASNISFTKEELDAAMAAK